jgi:hypothetical protein
MVAQLVFGAGEPQMAGGGGVASTAMRGRRWELGVKAATCDRRLDLGMPAMARG